MALLDSQTSVMVDSFFAASVASLNVHRDIILPITIDSIVLDRVLKRLSTMLNTSLAVEHDHDRKIIAVKLKGTEKTTMAKANLSKVPRPINSWILYRKNCHDLVRGQNPDVSNTDLSKIIAHMWKSEPIHVRNQWKKQAEQLKLAHKEKFPGYSYAPRRPGEKKRRRTKRARMAESAQSPSTSPNLNIEDFGNADQNPTIRSFEIPTSRSEDYIFNKNIQCFNDCQSSPPSHDLISSMSFTDEVMKAYHNDMQLLPQQLPFDQSCDLFLHDHNSIVSGSSKNLHDIITPAPTVPVSDMASFQDINASDAELQRHAAMLDEMYLNWNEDSLDNANRLPYDETFGVGIGSSKL